MRLTTIAIACAALSLGTAARSQPPPAAHSDAAPAMSPATAPGRAAVYIGGVRDTGQFLPDSTVLARVHDRTVRVFGFRDAYFSSLAQVRPAGDSLGRVEFLNSMINKEVLALTALAIDRPLGFEDRAVLREHTERLLSNALYRRAVVDSVVVTDDDVRRFHAGYSREQRYRRIHFGDPNAAAAVRRLLLARTLTWKAAVRRYSAAGAVADADGDMGWIARASLDPQMASRVWDLEIGAISPVVTDPDGFHLMMLTERRTVDPPALDAMHRLLSSQLRELAAAHRADRLQAQIAAHIGMVYDTTNIRWSARQFQGQETVQRGAEGMVLNLGNVGGDIGPADTSRVLARHRHGRYTVGDFLHAYNHQSPIMRQPVGDFESFRAQLDAIVLEPHMADEARARGLERDPDVVAGLERKREEILVEHLYGDSVEARVWISPAERRGYYQDRIAQYVTFPTARFAAIVRGSQAGADSLLGRLRAGERAADILHADSLMGLTSGSIQERRDDGQGGAYKKLLFEGLRPGQATVVGPDKEGTWMVIQLLEYDSGRQLPYEQVESLVDESLQNIRASSLLDDLIARHRKRYRIEGYPGLVMRIRLVDPVGD